MKERRLHDVDDQGLLGPPGWRGPEWRGSRWHGREWQRRGNGGPLLRDPEYRLAGGVAAGIAAWRGFNVATVRVVIVVACLFSQGWAIPLYFAAWLLLPAAGEEASIGAKARHDSRGVALALALGSLLSVIMLLVGILNNGLLATWGWPQVVTVACVTLIWRNAPPDEQAVMRHLIEPLSGVSVSGLPGPGGDGTGPETAGSARWARVATRLRLATGIAMLLVGVGWLLNSHHALAVLRPLIGVVLVTAGIVVLLGPWWFRIGRDLVLERQARARAEERAEVAARVHDSVLQTLALIQRRSDDPSAVVALARAQERELRSWLFEGIAPGTGASSTLAGGVREIQQDVEARHGVPVEVVTVGDCPLDDDLRALVAAAREAVVNAAKWSGAPVISLFAEVSPETAEIVVRDRGRGFLVSEVPGDRKGLAESIHGRMARHGGSVNVQSAPGEGTKVSLTMPRRSPAPNAAAPNAAAPNSAASGGLKGADAVRDAERENAEDKQDAGGRR